MRVIRINPKDPARALTIAANVMKAGGVVAYPTETFYGLAADALNPAAVEKVYAAKGRAGEKALPVILHDKSLITKYCKDLSEAARLAVEKLMPGPVTLIFHASDVFPDNLTAGTGKVAVRVPLHAIAAGLSDALGGPVTATSANVSGEEGLTSAREVAKAFRGKVDLLLDGGDTPGAPGTTILDLTVSPPAIVREGTLGRGALERALGRLSPKAKT